MKDLIKALNIFLSYCPDEDAYEVKYPFYCDHEILYVHAVSSADVSDEDKKILEKLGFHVDEDEEDNCFYSHRYGNC